MIAVEKKEGGRIAALREALADETSFGKNCPAK
jgi:hypothetical protein